MTEAQETPESSELAGAELAEAEAPETELAERPAPVADEVLLAAVDMARAALLDFTPADTIGKIIGNVAEEEHVLSLLFECRMTGYPGWHWTVTLSRIGDETKPTVLESELMPGENALLAPEWVPWSDRLAETQAAQLAQNAEQADEDEPDEDDDLDEDEDDEELDDEDSDDGFDDDYADELQSQRETDDIDGIDIDTLGSADDDDDDDDESDDDDDDDESDDDDDDESDEDDDDESDDDDDSDDDAEARN